MENNWISVEDRLPEKDYGWYLVVEVFDNGAGDVVKALYSPKELAWWQHGSGRRITVAYWMDLPELPQAIKDRTAEVIAEKSKVISIEDYL